MFNAKLMTTNMMKKLRINVLVSASPFRRICQLSASFSALAVGASGTTLLTWGVMPHVATSRSSLIPVILAAGTLSRLLFHGVHPVSLSISLRIALESFALNVGSPNRFLMGLVLAGGILELGCFSIKLLIGWLVNPPEMMICNISFCEGCFIEICSRPNMS